MLLNLTKMIFFFLRGAFCGLEYAENVFVTDPTGGAHDAPSEPLVGWGGDTPPLPHPTRRLRRLDPRVSGSRVCPVHIISGYATVYVFIYLCGSLFVCLFVCLFIS